MTEYTLSGTPKVVYTKWYTKRRTYKYVYVSWAAQSPNTCAYMPSYRTDGLHRRPRHVREARTTFASDRLSADGLSTGHLRAITRAQVTTGAHSVPCIDCGTDQTTSQHAENLSAKAR